MARPQSRAKAGYYPTPPEMSKLIAQFLTSFPLSPPPESSPQPSQSDPAPAPAMMEGALARCRLLDPCCGEGPAARLVGQYLGAETYGVEISPARAEKAKEVLFRVVAGDALHATCAPGTFGALFLNPPYDTTEDSLMRLEFAFLKKTTPYLQVQGVLALIVPQEVLGFERMTTYLGRWFCDLSVFRFCDPYYEAYSQVVVFGVKRAFPANGVDMEIQRDTLRTSAFSDLPKLSDPSSRRCYSVPGIKPGGVEITAPALDLSGSVATLREGGGLMTNSPEFVAETRPDTLAGGEGREIAIRPLMPLKKGHLSLLLASGLVKNILVRKNGSSLLIKGRQFKKEVPVESQDKDRTVNREQVVVEMRALNLATGEIINIRHGDGEEDE